MNTSELWGSRQRSARPLAVNFDRVARLYRWAEFLFLGPLLSRTRNHFVPQIQHARQVLVLGDGDGRFLAHLLRRAPSMQALAVDSSASMLLLLRRRCAFAGSRLTTIHGCVNPLPLGADLGKTDLIVTHFLLDCLPQDNVESLARQLATAAEPGCLWVISEFGIPQRNPWRVLARLYIRGLYLAFRVLTGLQTQSLPDIPGALTAAGFSCVHHAERLKGLLYSQLWQLPPEPASTGNAARCATSPFPAPSTLG